MAAKKILMLVGDFVEDYEVMVPFQALWPSVTPCTQCAPTKKPETALPQRSMISKGNRLIRKNAGTTSRSTPISPTSKQKTTTHW